MAGIDLQIDISTFPARIDQRRIGLQKGLNLLNQHVVREVVKRLARETPVDTGEARSNWILSLGAPSNDIRPAFAPKKKFTDPNKFRERANANGTIREAEPTILLFRPGDKEVQVLWIANNTPHISLLNDGALGKQPQNQAFFVQKAVREGTRLGFRKSKGFLFAKGRIVTARAAVVSGLRSIKG